MQHALDGTFRAGYDAALHTLSSRLRRHWTVVLLVTSIAMTAAAFAIASMPASYSSEALIQLSFSRDTPASGPSSQQIANVDGTSMVETAVRVIRSRGTARAVVARLRLDANGAFLSQSRLFRALNSLLPGAAMREAAPEDVATSALLNSLRVSYEPRSYLVTIRCTLGDPDQAAVVANAVAIEYLRGQLRTRLSEEFVAAQKQLVDLSRTYGERHPQYQAADGRLESLRARLGVLGTDSEPADMVATFAAEKFIPATAVSMPSGPNVPLMLAVALIASVLVGVAAALSLDRMTTAWEARWRALTARTEN